MWAVIWTLCLVSSCLAFPNEKTIRDNLNKVFTIQPNTNSPSPVTTTTESVFETTPTTLDCKCVPYNLCRGNLSEIVFNEHVIVKGPDDCSQNHTCCSIPNIKTSTDCGYSDPNGVGYRSETNFGEFPWMVLILKELTPLYQCGGSLIHKQVVLTAAHCVRRIKPSELKIRAGEFDRNTTDEIRPHQDRSVKNVIIHKNFGSGTLFYDFAILILSEPVNFAAHIKPVCLPEQNAVFDESRCFVTGWGKATLDRKEEYQTLLRDVELSVIPHNECQTSLRKTELGEQFRLHESFICAGGGNGSDTCKGDGGGPLVCPIKGEPERYQQAGIVSWGIECNSGAPGVYANVARVRDWIDEQIASHVLD